MDSYFNQLDDKSIISIPFLNLLYKTYPSLMVRLVTENYSILYGYILRLKHPLFYEAIRQSPQLLTDSIRIHLEKREVIDVYTLPIGEQLLDSYIDEKTLDSMLTQSITLAEYNIKPDNLVSIVDPITLSLFIDEVLSPIHLKYIPKDIEMTKDQLSTFFMIPNQRGGIIDIWGRNNIDFLRGRSNNIIPLVAPGLLPRPAATPAAIKAVSLLDKMQINRILLHNIELLTQPPSSLTLYKAFVLYPLSTTLVILKSDKDRILFDDVVDLNFFSTADQAINFYKIAISQYLEDDYIINNGAMIPTNIGRFHTSDYLKISLLDVDPFVKIEDVPPTSIKQHNAAQLANRLLGNPSQPYLSRDKLPTPIGVIDNNILMQAIGDKKSLVPSNMVIPSLDACIDRYKDLLPQSVMTAILLLLLYNSSSFLDWIEIFKKHSRMMRQIITISSLISEEEKASILERIS